ncbi:MAG: hypothetical protein R6X02_13875 [Enhygromyxa sp.]
MLGRWDRWEFYRDRRGQWRWSRFAAAELVGKSTESYFNRRDCEANAARLGWKRQAWPLCGYGDSWEFYRDTAGRFRWRRQARNGRIVGAAHMGFADQERCETNARRHGWQGEEQGACAREVGFADWRSCG